jgi:hypothetical protein
VAGISDPRVHAPFTISLRVAHGNTVRLDCRAATARPVVSLSDTMLRFSGSQTRATTTLVNRGTLGTPFCFTPSPSALYVFEPASGVLAPSQEVPVSVTFRPTAAEAHLSSAACVLEHHPPLFVTLLASERLDWDVVAQAMQLRRAGLDTVPPSRLEAMIQDGRVAVRDDGSLARVSPPPPAAAEAATPLKSPLKSPLPPPASPAATATPASVTVSPPLLDFGVCPAGSRKLVAGIPAREITVTNTTEGDVACQWAALPDAAAMTLEPMFAVVPRHGSATFSLAFRPPEPNRHYACQLECMAIFAGEPRAAPWRLTACAMGQTFPSAVSAVDRVSLAPSSAITLAPAEPGTQQYATLTLRNDATAPAHFSWSAPPATRLYPSSGFLPPLGGQVSRENKNKQKTKKRKEKEKKKKKKKKREKKRA